MTQNWLTCTRLPPQGRAHLAICSETVSTVDIRALGCFRQVCFACLSTLRHLQMAIDNGHVHSAAQLTSNIYG